MQRFKFLSQRCYTQSVVDTTMPLLNCLVARVKENYKHRIGDVSLGAEEDQMMTSSDSSIVKTTGNHQRVGSSSVIDVERITP